jgi:putative YphP/YqiW family bacilliredoxin
MYPKELVAPMAKDLNDAGFQSLISAEDVDQVLGAKAGTVLVVVNSVCGCAAANARPGAKSR